LREFEVDIPAITDRLVEQESNVDPEGVTGQAHWAIFKAYEYNLTGQPPSC